MNRPRIAPLGAALALACVTTAASATTYYYRDGYVTSAPTQVVRVERVTAPEIVAYDDRYVTYTTVETHPRVVERYVAPRETVVVQADPLYAPRAPLYSEWNPRHPHWGHLIDHGLFNRRGPTDFGR